MGLIYLDACLLIYLVEDHERWGKPIARAMENAADARFGISALTKAISRKDYPPLPLAGEGWGEGGKTVDG